VREKAKVTRTRLLQQSPFHRLPRQLAELIFVSLSLTRSDTFSVVSFRFLHPHPRPIPHFRDLFDCPDYWPTSQVWKQTF